MIQKTLFEVSELEEPMYCPICSFLGEVIQPNSCFRYCNKCKSKFGIAPDENF